MKTKSLLFLAAAVILLGPELALSAPASTRSKGGSKPSGKTPSKASAKSASKPKAVFTSVKGKVEIRKAGSKNRAVKKDSTAAVGDRVVASKDSSAVLKFFDGTELRIHPKTEIRINNLKEDGKDKTLTFKLFMGKVLASVKKLASPRSSFEIEAGGVVCGVRGTLYTMEYDPDTHKLDLGVDEGTVFSDHDGQTHEFHAGDSGEFLNGNLQGPGNDDQHTGLPPTGGNNGGNGNADALGDLDNTVGTGLVSNGDNTYNDPAVGGGVKVNVLINIDPTEALP